MCQWPLPKKSESLWWWLSLDSVSPGVSSCYTVVQSYTYLPFFPAVISWRPQILHETPTRFWFLPAYTHFLSFIQFHLTIKLDIKLGTFYIFFGQERKWGSDVPERCHQAPPGKIQSKSTAQPCHYLLIHTASLTFVCLKGKRNAYKRLRVFCSTWWFGTRRQKWK